MCVSSHNPKRLERRGEQARVTSGVRTGMAIAMYERAGGVGRWRCGDTSSVRVIGVCRPILIRVMRAPSFATGYGLATHRFTCSGPRRGITAAACCPRYSNLTELLANVLTSPTRSTWLAGLRILRQNRLRFFAHMPCRNALIDQGDASSVFSLAPYRVLPNAN